MSVTIYVIRHGKTVFNETGLCQGWNNSPLSETGIFQAQCAGTGLKGVVFTNAYCGTAGRQIDTTKTVLEFSGNPDIEVHPVEYFKEMGYGDFQGGPVDCLMETASKMLNTPVDHYASENNVVTPYEISTALGLSGHGAEKIEDSSKRLDEGIYKVVEENEGGTVLIGTSACAMDILSRTLFPEEIHYRLVDNCAVTIIQYDNGVFTLKKYGDTSYRLKGEELLKK